MIEVKQRGAGLTYPLNEIDVWDNEDYRLYAGCVLKIEIVKDEVLVSFSKDDDIEAKRVLLTVREAGERLLGTGPSRRSTI